MNILKISFADCFEWTSVAQTFSAKVVELESESEHLLDRFSEESEPEPEATLKF